MSQRRVLELFYDVVSPYSWLGFEVLLRYKNIWNIDLQLRPAYLGAIMQATGNAPPAMVPKRGAYLGKDLKRQSQYFQVDLKQPSDFFHVAIKKGTLLPMRFVTAVQMFHPESVESVSRELWKRIWYEDKDITESESILEAATKAGMSEEDAKKTLATISSPEVKKQLQETTESALKYGAFGMPSIVVHVNGKPELYFGSDRFELLAHNLGEKWYGPVPPKSHL